MPTTDAEKTTRTPASLAKATAAALAWLKRHASKKVRVGMARYAIPSDRAYGVPMRLIQQLARKLGPDHALAEALWQTEIYEARLLAAYVGDPARVTPGQMDRWCRDFDNWAVVDTVCFVLFNQTPHAWRKVGPWVRRKDEYQRRAGFVLLACLPWREAADDARFLRLLPLIEQGATDPRNFVKKGVNWALRSVGRRSLGLHAATVALAGRLAAADDPTARWVGKDALKQLTGPAMMKRVQRLEQPG